MLRPVPDRGADDDGRGGRAGCVLGICEGNGFVLQDDGEAVPCECRDGLIGRGVSRGMGTGIPKRYREVSFERKPICDLDRRILLEVRAFVDRIDEHVDSGRGIWFAGDLGTGKTSLAMLVCKAAEEKGRSVAIYPFTRLLAEIKETYDSTAGNSYMSLYRRLCAVDLLQLDDVGAEKRTDWVLEQLYSIVNERWQDERSVAITTNTVDLDQLREQIGPRTVSRLIEMCGNPIPLWGDDLRLTSAG